MNVNDWIFFKGNLLFLPSHVSNIAARSTINEGNTVDNQRAMKQLEMSNKIQTGLELKIETLRKEIRTSLIESFLFFIDRFSL